MNSVEIDIASSDFELVEDKYTQTNEESKKPPVSTNTVETNKGSVTIFEFSQVVQDPNCPELVTIVNEKVTEETVNHPSNSSEETNTANRYKYYREVIKPYIKNKPKSSATSEEYLQAALNSAGEDFPDYQPRSHKTNFQRDISTLKALFTDILGKVDAVTSFRSMDAKDSKECVPNCESKDPVCPPPDSCHSETQEQTPSTPKNKPPCGPPPHQRPKCDKPKICKPKIKKVCPKDSDSKCDDPSEVVIVAGPDKKLQFFNEEPNESFESYESSFSDRETVSTTNETVNETVTETVNESPKTFFEAHNKAMATIKRGMEDFLDKVYKTTQDAVTVITTESSKQYAKVKTTEPASVVIGNNDNGSTGSEQYSFRRSIEGPNGTSGAAAEVIGTILTTVDSALTLLGQQVTKSLENLPRPSNFNNRSSPYDQPRYPNEITNETPISKSVFSVIKSKIYSMFSEAEPKVEVAPLSIKSSSDSVQEDDSEEDLSE